MTEFKDVERELSRFRQRLLAVAVLVVLAFIGLFTRLVYLQVVRHDELMARAERNRTAIVPVAPTRGHILDRNGVVLASNYSPTRWRSHRPRSARWSRPSMPCPK